MASAASGDGCGFAVEESAVGRRLVPVAAVGRWPAPVAAVVRRPAPVAAVAAAVVAMSVVVAACPVARCPRRSAKVKLSSSALPFRPSSSSDVKDGWRKNKCVFEKKTDEGRACMYTVCDRVPRHVFTPDPVPRSV